MITRGVFIFGICNEVAKKIIIPINIFFKNPPLNSIIDIVFYIQQHKKIK